MSEIRPTAYLEPLPDFVKEGPLVMIMSWRAPAANHDRIVAHTRGNIDPQRLAPAVCFYSRTRHWYRPLDGGTEQWWFMDEYDSAEAFEQMQKRYRQVSTGSDSQNTQKIYDEWLSLVVPDSVIVQTLFSEVPEGRIEFEPYAQRARAIAQQSQ